MTSSARSAVPGGVRILDRLRDEGRISPTQYESYYHQAKRTGERIEEAILASGDISEAELLKFIAALYQTRYVSTERLSKADIDPAVLELVPRRVAERLQCVPILLDRRTQTLSVVTFDLEEDIGKQIQVLTRVREVRVLVARPAAVRAAIRRFYAGEVDAFAAIPVAPVRFGASIEPFERTALPARSSPFGGGIELEIEGFPGVGLSPGPVPSPPVPPPASAPAMPPLEAVRFEVPRPAWLEREAYLETVKVFATLLDAPRGELRGHASHVARLVRQISDRLGLADEEKYSLLLAALLHDVGKTSTYHLTALNVSRFDGHRLQAERSYLTPVRIFESAKLPSTTVDVLTHLYERWDGKGFPDRQGGKEIPLGARVIAIVETYADLTVNPKNPYRKTLSPRQAIDVLRQLAGQLFDPMLVDVLRQVLSSGERGAGRGTQAGRLRTLVIDPDREETTMLEVRLAEAGHEVVVAHDRKEAEAALSRHRFSVILSEVELGDESGFALLAALRADSRTKDIPFVFLTRKADRETVARGFDLGAADFLVKPASAEVVVAKIAKILEGTPRERSAGLAGNLRDMSLPDLIQALSNGRKSGLLRIHVAGNQGEIHFLDGAIAEASFPPRNRQEAVYALLALKDGEFSFDPAFKPPARVIEESTEALLLEGMRRIDEKLV